MKYVIDHDYHIHSMLSLCSDDPEQNKEAILAYGVKNGFTHLCLTDHLWDGENPSEFYRPQNMAHIREALPLPEAAATKFHFGAEVDMDRFLTIGLRKESYDALDLIIVPTTHLHMMGFTLTEEDNTLEGRAALYVKRFRALLDSDLPSGKTGIAHLTCSLVAPAQWEDHLAVLDKVTDVDLGSLFAGAAKRGFGIELNMPVFRYTEEELPRVLRPYRIAKECGCLFYLGSDAHHPAGLAEAVPAFARMTELLELCEKDKFRPFE